MQCVIESSIYDYIYYRCINWTPIRKCITIIYVMFSWSWLWIYKSYTNYAVMLSSYDSFIIILMFCDVYRYMPSIICHLINSILDTLDTQKENNALTCHKSVQLITEHCKYLLSLNVLNNFCCNSIYTIAKLCQNCWHCLWVLRCFSDMSIFMNKAPFINHFLVPFFLQFFQSLSLPCFPPPPPYCQLELRFYRTSQKINEVFHERCHGILCKIVG